MKAGEDPSDEAKAKDTQAEQASSRTADRPSSPGEPAGEGVPAEEDEVTAALAEAAKLRDQLLRTAADFDNFRKRSRRETEEAERRGREDMLREMLPVFDNLERAASHAEAATDVRSLAEGIALVMRQFADTLAKLGVERAPGVGAPFDPTVHEAIQHLQTSEHPPGTVAAEVQAGYRMGERLIRPGMVVVAKAPD